MNIYERIYDLLTEESLAQQTSPKSKKKKSKAIVSVLRKRAEHAGEKTGRAETRGEITWKQADTLLGQHEKATDHHGGGTTKTRERFRKGMIRGARGSASSRSPEDKARAGIQVRRRRR